MILNKEPIPRVYGARFLGLGLSGNNPSSIIDDQLNQYILQNKNYSKQQSLLAQPMQNCQTHIKLNALDAFSNCYFTVFSQCLIYSPDQLLKYDQQCVSNIVTLLQINKQQRISHTAIQLFTGRLLPSHRIIKAKISSHIKMLTGTNKSAYDIYRQAVDTNLPFTRNIKKLLSKVKMHSWLDPIKKMNELNITGTKDLLQKFQQIYETNWLKNLIRTNRTKYLHTPMATINYTPQRRKLFYIPTHGKLISPTNQISVLLDCAEINWKKTKKKCTVCQSKDTIFHRLFHCIKHKKSRELIMHIAIATLTTISQKPASTSRGHHAAAIVHWFQEWLSKNAYTHHIAFLVLTCDTESIRQTAKKSEYRKNR